MVRCNRAKRDEEEAAAAAVLDLNYSSLFYTGSSWSLREVASSHLEIVGIV
jgi:hypothetical protein